MENKRLYNIWSCMKQRCNNPNHTAARWYHDKGISVCEEWMTFDSFEKWALGNGYSDNLTIDRINPDGNYEPSNCRWISRNENATRARRSQAVSRKKGMFKKEGKYDVIFCFANRYEVVEERGYSYHYANERVSELNKNNREKGCWYLKRKTERSKEVGEIYFA